MQIFVTIFAGVLVFVIGQAILKFLLEPLQDFRRTVSKIAHALIEHANVYCNPGRGKDGKHEETSVVLRKLSSELYADRYLTPFYRSISTIFCLPSEKAISEAARDLIGLSNAVFLSDEAIANADRANNIRKSLGIYGEKNED